MGTALLKHNARNYLRRTRDYEFTPGGSEPSGRLLGYLLRLTEMTATNETTTLYRWRDIDQELGYQVTFFFQVGDDDVIRRHRGVWPTFFDGWAGRTLTELLIAIDKKEISPIAFGVFDPNEGAYR